MRWKSVWIFFWPLAFQGFVRNSFCPERNTGQWVLRSNFWIFSKTWHVDECKIGQRGWSEIIWGIWRLGDFLGQCGTWEPSLGCLDALRRYALNKPPSSGQCPTSRPSDQPGKRLIIVKNNFWTLFAGNMTQPIYEEGIFSANLKENHDEQRPIGEKIHLEISLIKFSDKNNCSTKQKHPNLLFIFNFV